MGFTTRVKSEASEKKPFNFALFWDKYGTFFILAIIVAIFGSLSPEYFLTTNNITQIFVQSSVTVLIGMGEFFAILVAGIDLSVGAILALSGCIDSLEVRKKTGRTLDYSGSDGIRFGGACKPVAQILVVNQ